MCRTASSSSDVLSLYLGPSLDQPVTLNGNPVYFSGTNFPKTSQIIEGDTVTFVFNASSRPDPLTRNIPSRWGFKCIVTELASSHTFKPTILHWLLDLENSIGLLCGKTSSFLVEGEPISELEKKYQEWLETELFQGGLEDIATNKNSESSQWLEDFVDKDGKEALLYKWIKQNPYTRPIQAQKSAVEVLEKTEKYAIAAMLKHMCLLKEAAQFSSMLAVNQSPPIDLQAKFKFLGKKSSQICSWIHQRGLLQKEWQIATDPVKPEPFDFEGYKQKPELLSLLCEMKNVEFDLMNMDESIKALSLKLNEEIESMKKSENPDIPNPFEVVAKPVIERMKFLMKLLPNFGERHPSAYAANPLQDGDMEILHTSHPHTSSKEDPSDPHPLSRSLSSVPVTSASLEKIKLREKEQQNQKQFVKRVGELRKWIQDYHRWQKWRDSALLIKGLKEHETPPASPLQAILSFSQATQISVNQIERLIRIQVSRAKSRIHGLKHLNEFLKFGSFGSVRHQIIGSIGYPLLGGGHYFNGVASCGYDLAVKVEQAFSLLFEELVKILAQPANDPTSRLLALGICGLSFKDYDVHLLQSTNIFQILCEIISEKDPVPPTLLAKSTDSSHMEVDEESEEQVGTKAQTPEEGKEKFEKDDEVKRRNSLKVSAWTAFRLLATQCSSWSLGGGPRSAILQLQGHVFDLMCQELQRLSKNLKKHNIGQCTGAENEDGDQCYQLLSLLYMLGGSSLRLKSLSNHDNVSSLVSILGTNTAPRSQRLVLRLCRRLLPLQTSETVESTALLLLDEVGKWLCDAKYSKGNSKSDTMDIDKENKRRSGEAVDSESEDDKSPSIVYGVLLHRWPLGDKKLVETCISVLGQDFLFDGRAPGRMASQSTEARAQAILQEISTSGSAMLKTGNLDQCSRLAKELAVQGAVVTLTESISEEHAPKKDKNPNEVQKSKWPLYWANGHIASSLASECIALLRFLLGSSTLWTETLKKLLQQYLLEVPKIIENSSIQVKKKNINIHRILASLCVIGGYQESVRVGAKVLVKNHTGEVPKSGVIVSYLPALSKKADVILDSDEEPKSVHKVDISSLIAVPEIRLDPSFIQSFAAIIIPSLLSVVQEEKANSKSINWLYSEIKLRALSALVDILSLPEAAHVLLNPCVDKVPLLIDMAQKCDPSISPENLASNHLQLSQHLWDVYTNPVEDLNYSKSPMVTVLPYFPYNAKADLLPTGLDGKQVSGLIFWGMDKRSVEYTGYSGQSSGRSRSLFGNFGGRTRTNQTNEVLIQGNVPIPINIEYYFEVTIEKADATTIISVGFCPEGSPTWGNGSYRYQANRLKTWYVHGTRKQEAYGTFYRSKHTVGCGWDPETKSIYFTKDGEDLGPAFDNVILSERVVPVIGIGKGVKATVNFGQEKFKFNLLGHVDMDESTREQKRKEAEEKRLKELQDAKVQAAQPILNMGYTMKQALKALEITQCSGTEPAVLWLLENPDFNFDDEDEPEKPPVKEEIPEKKVEPVEQIEPMVVEKEETGPPENAYKVTNSAQYHLRNCNIFEPSRKKKQKSSMPNISSEWEERHIPELKNFMERDQYSNLEISDHLEQIRTVLRQGKEEEAIGIYRQILGDQAQHIRLPSISKDSDANTLKIDQIHIGDGLIVKEIVLVELPPTISKFWIEPMSRTIGETGFVKALDHKQNLVLMRFYNPEYATLVEWWYPVCTLLKPKKAITEPISDITAPHDLESKVIDAQTKLSNIFSRRVALTLLKHTPVTISEGPLKVLDVLHLAGDEFLSSHSVLSSSKPLLNEEDIENGMGYVSKKLLDLFGSLKTAEGATDLSKLLLKDCLRLIAEAQNMIKRTETFQLEQNKFGTSIPCDINKAHALLVLFDRSCNIAPGSNTKLAFYLDEQCTKPVKSFSEKTLFTPFVVSGNKFYYKALSSQQNNCKFKFVLVPTTIGFALARYIIEFLSKYALDYVNDMDKIFNACLDYIYYCSPPTSLKEALFGTLSSLIYRLRSKGESFKLLSNFPWKRLSKLSTEMVTLFDTEKRRATLYSSYLQNLIDFMVSVKLQNLHRNPSKKPKEKIKEIVDVTQPEPQTPQEPATPTENVMQVDKPTEPTTISDSQKEPKKEETTSGEQIIEKLPVVEEKLSTEEIKKESESAKAESKADDPSDKPIEKSQDEKVDDDSPKEDLDASLAQKMGEFYDEMDDEMRMAIQLSLGQSIEPEQTEEKKEDENISKQEDKKESGGESDESSSEEEPEKPEKKVEEPKPAIVVPTVTPPKTPVAPEQPKKKGEEPAWFVTLVQLAQTLEFLYLSERDPRVFTSSKYYSKVYNDTIQKAWEQSKKESIKERIVYISNLPSVPAEKKSEFVSFLQDYLDECITLVKGKLYLSLDEKKKNTNTYCFVEFQVSDIDKIKEKVANNKLKLPAHLNARASSKKDKQLQVFSFAEVKAGRDPDHIKHLQEYLRSLLYSENTKTVTNECKDLITDVFILFAGSKDGVLVAEDLDKLQLVTNNEPFGQENIEYVLKTYETKTIKKKVNDVEVDVNGLTLNGFISLYTAQCDTQPMETWDEFTNLGYDFHLTKSCYNTLDEALKSMHPTIKRERDGRPLFSCSLDEEIIKYAESISTEIREMNNPVSLTVQHLSPIKLESPLAQIYPHIASLDSRQFYLRFEILRQFNAKLSTSSPLFNLEGTSPLVRYLLRFRGLIFHSIKMEYFYDVLDKTAISGGQPTVSYNRLKLASRLEKRDPNQKVTDEHMLKNTAFGIAFSQVRHTSPELYRQKKPPGSEAHFSILIGFKGENVEGEGGPYRQFFTDVSKELQNGSLPLLIPCPNAQQKTGKNRDKFVVAPSMKSRQHLRMYRFLGQLMGMSIRTGVMLTLDLPSFVWKPLVGAPLKMSDLKEVDHSFYGSLKFFRSCSREHIEGKDRTIFEKFQIVLSDKSLCPLKKDGERIDLTFDNINEWIELAEKARINESKLQLKEIRRGLCDVIPSALLNLLTWQDLEWRVCGKPTIDIKLLKRHTEYPNAPHIQYFWQILESFGPEDRRAFIRFAWGQERLPANDQEFSRTSTRMLIRTYTTTKDPDQTFPKADTCFFNLHLPEYSSPEILREKLLMAIHTDADSMNADNPQEADDALRLGIPEF